MLITTRGTLRSAPLVVWLHGIFPGSKKQVVNFRGIGSHGGINATKDNATPTGTFR